MDEQKIFTFEKLEPGNVLTGKMTITIIKICQKGFMRRKLEHLSYNKNLKKIILCKQNLFTVRVQTLQKPQTFATFPTTLKFHIEHVGFGLSQETFLKTAVYDCNMRR